MALLKQKVLVCSLLFVSSLLLGSSSVSAKAPMVEVQGLFTGAAVIKVDGTAKMLRVGQSFAGVMLVDSTSQQVILEIAGERHVMKMSQRISSSYLQPKVLEVSITRDAALQYNTSAAINGHRVQVLVDTGANLIAMNSDHAVAMGVDYAAGEAMRVETASGMQGAKLVNLTSVDVGGIRVENVRAAVIEGGFPTTILLGMSFLKHVDMKESGGILSLSRAY
ncbi:MAG: aspartyl protease family protein [Halioglobus sp.]|jgi:aspartyl protease family protein